MPPKSSQRSHKKPLNPLQRKLQKKKHELIHKATVKGQYYKTLAKEDQDLNTPDYVKEIFGERTIDEDGNVVKYQDSTQGDKEETKPEDDHVYDLDNPSSDEESKEEETSSKRKRTKQKDEVQKRHKPNPFKAQLDTRKKAKEELEKEREEKRKMIEEKIKAKEEYMRHRRRERSKMLAKNRKGQPNMATQMDVLLEKIKKQAEN
ncbi:hypothetical protein EC973_006086 [Apophysomyces ossiformis]|uniref:rRNA-processing protein FYV7 n=1 Tax=Apophysomyces ossiformis TaxID=679940 RepID=A0A8H7BFM7_9FUNG|nr:hypothetical protein EC973_006086 [Apophysomyces ossiformis]